MVREIWKFQFLLFGQSNSISPWKVRECSGLFFGCKAKCYKFSYFILSLVFFMFFLESAAAENQQCQLNFWNKNLEVAGCQKEGSVSILRLVSRGLSPYATES